MRPLRLQMRPRRLRTVIPAGAPPARAGGRRLRIGIELEYHFHSGEARDDRDHCEQAEEAQAPSAT
jgi:hypothetical protein